MIFNRYISLICLCLSVAFLTACSDFLKGKPKEEKTLEIKQVSLSCLNEVSLNVKKFLKSESNDAEIEKTFSCFDSTLREFQTKVEGASEKDSFTASELQQIFGKFIKDANLSSEATSDLLVLKAALLGGTGDKISKTEITLLREYLLLIKSEIKNLLPYSQLFSFKKNEVSLPKSLIQAGFSQLNQSLKKLLKASKVSHSNYQFNDLKKLALNLNLVNDSQLDLVKLAEKLNDLLVGPQPILSEPDRALYIDNLTEMLRLYSVQLQGYVKFQIGNTTDLSPTFEYVHDVLVLLENSHQFKKTKIITAESLDPLITEILKKDILPLKLSTETALNIYKTLIIRVFESGLSADVNAFTGVKSIHLLNMKRELAVYRILNQIISDTVSENRMPLKEIQAKMKSFDIKKMQEILREFDQPEQQQIVTIVEEIRNEFLVKTPVMYRFNKVVLAANQEVWDQNREDLSRHLYVTMLSRELLLGWGQTPLVKELKNAVVTDQGLVQWYSEFKKFGIEVKTFDPRSKNSGASNLISANLFTRTGNGDNKLTFREAVQFLSLLFSGGGQVYHEIAAGLKKANCNLPELDVFENNWNNEACAIENLRHHYNSYFSNLPYLVRYLDKLSKSEVDFRAFYDSIMNVTRIDVKSVGRLETADLRNMSTLLHYVESLFATYDLDRNGFLSEQEIKSTYPKFKSFAEKYARNSAGAQLDSFNYWSDSILGLNSCFTEQDLIKESFVFMVYFGKTPALSDLTSFPCLRNEPLIRFNGEVDRKRIINTFKIIKAVLGS